MSEEVSSMRRRYIALFWVMLIVMTILSPLLVIQAQAKPLWFIWEPHNIAVIDRKYIGYKLKTPLPAQGTVWRYGVRYPEGTDATVEQARGECSRRFKGEQFLYSFGLNGWICLTPTRPR